MNIGFRNANPNRGGESYYVTFHDPIEGTTACLLVDSGEGVSVERDLADDEYLVGVLLTHGHLDHYRTLADNIADGAPVLTSPSTAAVIETIHREGERNYDLSGTDTIAGAIESVEGWHELRDDLAVHPIPTGHAPGAVGFVIRCLDGSTPVYLLATGDFGFDAAAGYPPFSTDLPIEIDAAFVCGATNDETTRTDIVTTGLTRAREGSTVLVTTGGLTGVEYAYLFGHASEKGDSGVAVTVVGQLAKLYDDLKYDVPNVESVPTFEDAERVLAPGGICLAGPEVPIDGSAKRLFGWIEDDPGGTLIQIASSNEPPVATAGCTVYSYRHTAHPTIGEIDELVDALVPIHTVITHGNHRTFKDRYDGTFTWTDTTATTHTLYADGQWREPPWIDDELCKLIRERYNRKRGARVGDIFDEADLGFPELPTPGRDRPDLAAEGLDVDRLDSLAATVGESVESKNRDPTAPPTNAEDATDAALEATQTVEDAPETTDTERILARLDAIESKLSEGHESVRVRVIDAGDGDVLFRALDPVDLEHGEELSVSFLT